MFAVRCLAAITALLCAGGLLVACASTPPGPQFDVDGIRTVLVNQQPAGVPRFQYQRRIIGEIRAPLNELAELAEQAQRSGRSGNAEQILALAIQNNGISIFDITKAQFISSANQLGGMVFGDVTPVMDAELLLTIDYFGFHRPNLFGTTLAPILRVSAELRRPDGRLVWYQSESVTLPDTQSGPSRPIDHYLEKPEYIREAFTQAAALVTEKIVQKLPRPEADLVINQR